MLNFGTHYDWYSWCYKDFSACCIQAFTLLLPVALPAFTPMQAFHERGHRWRIRWYTSGFL